MMQQVEAIHRVIMRFNEAFESQKTVVSFKKGRKTQTNEFTLLFSSCSPAAKWKYQKLLLVINNQIHCFGQVNQFRR